MLMSFLSTISSLFFFFLNHPISLVLAIMVQTLIICFLIFINSFSSWFSIILFLIFMGGLMVLFIYISSLASNEMFKLNFSLTLVLMSLSFLILSMSFIYFTNFDYINIFEEMNFKNVIYSIYSNFLIIPTLLMMMYLLVTLIITVNIIKLYEAPIRSLL